MSAVSLLPKTAIPFVCSWSGGKDSCLALYSAMRAGATPSFLLTMFDESGQRSRSHGLTKGVLQAQTALMGIPWVTRMASWSEYESVFIAALQELKKVGVKAGVFGDIDIEDHRLWEEKVCKAASIEAYLPLWKAPRTALLDEFLVLGFNATIIATCDEKVDKKYLGRALDAELISEFTCIGIDPSGEEGEYHTIVTDGPIFAQPLQVRMGGQVFRSGYWFLELEV